MSSAPIPQQGNEPSQAKPSQAKPAIALAMVRPRSASFSSLSRYFSSSSSRHSAPTFLLPSLYAATQPSSQLLMTPPTMPSLPPSFTSSALYSQPTSSHRSSPCKTSDPFSKQSHHRETTPTRPLQVKSATAQVPAVMPLPHQCHQLRKLPNSRRTSQTPSSTSYGQSTWRLTCAEMLQDRLLQMQRGRQRRLPKRQRQQRRGWQTWSRDSSPQTTLPASRWPSASMFPSSLPLDSCLTRPTSTAREFESTPLISTSSKSSICCVRKMKATRD